MSATEQVRFLAASEHRIAVLRSLVSDSHSPAQLRDSHDISRATVQRILDSFTEFGWVRRGDTGYVATSAGRIVLQKFDTLFNTVNEVDSLSDFLSQFERAHKIPVPLNEYRVVSATQTDPYAPAEYFVSSIPEDATQLRALLPTIVPAFNRACEPLVERRASIQLVLSQPAAETSRQSYSEDFERARSIDSISLSISPKIFWFGLSVFDDDVFLGAYIDEGRFQACLHSTEDQLREWALSTFQTFREDATSVQTFESKQ